MSQEDVAMSNANAGEEEEEKLRLLLGRVRGSQRGLLVSDNRRGRDNGRERGGLIAVIVSRHNSRRL